MILYASLISGVSAWLVVLLVVISLVQILSYKLANNYELKHRDAKAKLTVTQDYLDRQAYAVENGKDIRLYQMKEWLSGHYRAANKKYQALLAKEKACYFADDLFGLLLQLGRDVVCYGYLIGQLMQGNVHRTFCALYRDRQWIFHLFFGTYDDDQPDLILLKAGRTDAGIYRVRECISPWRGSPVKG